MTDRLHRPGMLVYLTALFSGLLLLLPVTLPASQAAPSNLSISTAFQDSYPKFYIDRQGQHTGICTDLATALIDHLDRFRDTSTRRLMPLRRIRQRLAEKDGIDFFMGLALNEERARLYDYVEPALYEVNHVIAVRSDDPARIDSLAEIPRDAVLMTIGGSSTERFLEGQGFTNVDGSANDSTQLLKKLVHKRARFVYFNDIALKAEIKRMGLRQEVRILPTSFRKYAHYLVINKNTDPLKKEAIISTYHEMRGTGQVETILDKYIGED